LEAQGIKSGTVRGYNRKARHCQCRKQGEPPFELITDGPNTAREQGARSATV